MVYTINFTLGETPLEPVFTKASTKSSQSFAQTLAAVPLFTAWNNIPPTSSSSPFNTSLTLTTHSATNRRNDGRRRSSS